MSRLLDVRFRCTFCRDRLRPARRAAGRYVWMLFGMEPCSCPHCFSVYIRPARWVMALLSIPFIPFIPFMSSDGRTDEPLNPDAEDGPGSPGSEGQNPDAESTGLSEASENGDSSVSCSVIPSATSSPGLAGT